MKSKTIEKVKTYEAKGFREKFLGLDNPMQLLFKSNSDHFFCLKIFKNAVFEFFTIIAPLSV